MTHELVEQKRSRMSPMSPIDFSLFLLNDTSTVQAVNGIVCARQHVMSIRSLSGRQHVDHCCVSVARAADAWPS